MRVLGALVLLAACGGGDDVGLLFDGGVEVDATPSCGVTWELVEVQATALTLLDPVAAVEGRSVRVGVTIDLNACDELAMITVGYTLEGSGAVISPRVWRPLGIDCPPTSEPVMRPVVLEDLFAATWMISAFGADSLSVTVADTASTCDTTRTRCQLDCDCNEAGGERCLGYSGLAGPITECAKPCELDRDCGGTACEVDVDDGLGHACSARPECGAGRACPTGWTCDAGACTPDFALNNVTRRECACDDDCDPGMRCANPYDPAEPRRCEALCQTAGPWCEGAHMCGWIGLDAAGLADVDSVCVWLGE